MVPGVQFAIELDNYLAKLKTIEAKYAGEHQLYGGDEADYGLDTIRADIEGITNVLAILTAGKGFAAAMAEFVRLDPELHTDILNHFEDQDLRCTILNTIDPR